MLPVPTAVHLYVSTLPGQAHPALVDGINSFLAMELWKGWSIMHQRIIVHFMIYRAHI